MTDNPTAHIGPLDLPTRTQHAEVNGSQVIASTAMPEPVIHALAGLVDAGDSACQHPRSPAPHAGDNASRGTEHRHVVPGTPAPHAGTPAPHDTNTGTTCTPPPKDQPLPPKDQRDESVEDVTTRGDLLAELIKIDELAARRRGA